MEESSTERFFRLMNEANEKIAAEEAAKKPISEVVGDPIRLKRQAERRERFGQLRARPKNRSKSQSIRNAFGHINLEP